MGQKHNIHSGIKVFLRVFLLLLEQSSV